MNRCLPLAWIAGQAAVIADAQDVADVEADTIGYVEAHGTGTALPRLPVVSPRTGDWMTEGREPRPQHLDGPQHLDRLGQFTARPGRPPRRHRPPRTPPHPAGRRTAGHAHLLTLAAGQWVLGADLGFAAVHTDRDNRRVPLPTHRFEQRCHWVEPGDHTTSPAATPSGDRLIARFDPEDPHQNVELVTDYLTEEVGKVLGGRHLAALDTNLFDLGLDSLVLIEVVAKLGEQLDFEFPA